MASKRTRWAGRRVVMVAGAMVVGLASIVSYGVAQNSVVTQAEWVVYMVQALDLDWNLPENAKTKDYIDRLNWTASIEFDATRSLPGSSLLPESEDGLTFLRATDAPGEALYRVATLQPGDYNLRVKMSGGSAVFKVGSAVFEIDQPAGDFKWVDLERVGLGAGPHDMSLVASNGTRVASLAITPPCLRRIEPTEGWRSLAPLRFGDMAVSIAKALNIENELAGLGPAIVIDGERFERDLEVPMGQPEDPSASGPFWLKSGNALLTARARFNVPEKGLYSLEARYLSPNHPVRWVFDGCIKAVTCEREPAGGLQWTAVTALELEAGDHDVEITLPPRAGLDRVSIQRRDASVDEYVRAVEDAGIRLGPAGDGVRRRQAVGAAQKLRESFRKRLSATCYDNLAQLEHDAVAAAARNMAVSKEELLYGGSTVRAVPPPKPEDPLFPRGNPEGSSVASPTMPGPPR